MTYHQQQKRERALQRAQQEQDERHVTSVQYHAAIGRLLDVLRRDKRQVEVLAAFDFRVRQTMQPSGMPNMGEMVKYIALTVHPLFCANPTIRTTAMEFGRSPLDVCADICWRYTRQQQAHLHFYGGALPEEGTYE